MAVREQRSERGRVGRSRIRLFLSTGAICYTNRVFSPRESEHLLFFETSIQDIPGTEARTGERCDGLSLSELRCFQGGIANESLDNTNV